MNPKDGSNFWKKIENEATWDKASQCYKIYHIDTVEAYLPSLLLS